MKTGRTARVLIVEDDHAVRHLVAAQLQRQGLCVTATATAAAARTALDSCAFDIAILDVTLPDGSGLDLLPIVRQRESTAHVIILSGAASEADRVRALTLGGDDYVVKPFFVRELAARVLAVGRRRDAAEAGHLEYGSVVIDIVARSVTVGDQLVALTAKEFDLLAFLAARPHQAFSRDELLRSVWQSTAGWQTPATVTEHMRRLRSKLEANPNSPHLLETVRGVGYRFDPPT